MQVNRLSKSGIETFEDCEHKFNLAYNLGFKGDDNISAVMGNVYHSIMQFLALSTKQEKFTDDVVGEVDLSDLDPIKLTELVFEKYKEKYTHLEFTNTHLTNCKRWVNRSLLHQDGRYDPRNLEVVDIEKWFDFEVEGVSVRGFIDLVTKEDENTYRVLDYKTGSDFDFKNKRPKDTQSLNRDIQLRLYHYACCNILYPEIENIIVEIYFVNTYKIFTFHWDRDELYKVDLFLNKKIDKIKAVEKPKLNYDACKICSFDKHLYKDSNKTICHFFKDKIEEIGLEKTIGQYKEK